MCGLLLIGAAGCGAGGNDTLAQTGRDLRVTLTANAPDACGQTGDLTLTVANSGSRALTLASPDAALFDVQVQQNGKTVWDYGLSNVVRASQDTLAPGASKTYTVAWHGEDAQGNGLAPGNYTVTATLAPASINGAGVSQTQARTLLPVATAPLTITQPCGPVFVADNVLVGGELSPQQAAPIGSLANPFGDGNSGSGALLLKLKAGVSVEAGVAFLQSYPLVRYAEPNGIGTTAGRAARRSQALVPFSPVSPPG